MLAEVPVAAVGTDLNGTLSTRPTRASKRGSAGEDAFQRRAPANLKYRPGDTLRFTEPFAASRESR